MNLTILTDDTPSNNKKLLTEHGLCFYIEDDGKKILFDTGYSDVFIKNAISMGINLLELDYIVISHGHYDHTWGLSHYLALYSSALKKKEKIKKPIIVTHPDTFLEKLEEGYGEIGCIIPEIKLRKSFDVILTKEPFQLTNNLVFLGEIPRINNFEGKEPIKKVLINKKYQDDYVTEDSALVYKTTGGLSVITGCSHSGICNIIEYAKKICNESTINNVIGGFHLIDTPKEIIDKITNYLETQNIKELYPCHCTDTASKAELAKKLNVANIGVGFKQSF